VLLVSHCRAWATWGPSHGQKWLIPRPQCMHALQFYTAAQIRTQQLDWQVYPQQIKAILASHDSFPSSTHKPSLHCHAFCHFYHMMFIETKMTLPYSTLGSHDSGHSPNEIAEFSHTVPKKCQLKKNCNGCNKIIEWLPTQKSWLQYFKIT